ncbi:MAG: hypothetical protein ACRDLQ_06470 [Solirubrobacterales bacterium]
MADRRRRRRPDYRPPGRPAEARARASVRREDEASSPARRPPRERPPAPWGRFPLVELVILLGLGLLVAGFFVQGGRGLTMIAAGVALASLAGLELSIREHLAGYRSHSTVLAGVVTVVALAVGYFLLPSKLFAVNLLIGAVVFGVCFYALREVFKRRSGGLGFR